MKAEWLKLAARFDALQVRERWLVAAALLGGLLLISYHFFLDPALAKAKQAEQQIVQSHSQITTLSGQIALLQAPGHDPDTAARAELAQLKKQMSEFAAEFKELEDSLVPPGKTAELLEDMVGQKSSLRLISLKTLPASPLLEKKAEVDEHGSNDAQKTMGIITMALVSYHALDTFVVPAWVILSCAVTMGLGTMAGGWRIIRTMGSKMIKLKPVHGFAAETSAAAVILTASHFGIPVSTTHVISTSIMGVGSTKGVHAVKWGIVGNIVLAWVLTIPVCMVIAAILYRILPV